MSEPLTWDETAARLARELGEPVSGGRPLTPGWSSRMTSGARGERTGPLVVKARRGDGDQAAADRLLARAARAAGSAGLRCLVSYRALAGLAEDAREGQLPQAQLEAISAILDRLQGDTGLGSGIRPQ
ncbi:MAG TPA: hypothetical protein VGH88_16740 [Streptosporangiaceae bacterium]